MSNQNYITEDEIDLHDCIRVILKRWKIILTVFFVAVITTAIASFLMPQIYEATYKVQIGRIDELLMKKEEAKEMLLSPSLLALIIKEFKLDIKIEELRKKVKIEDIKDTDLLEINVQYHDADMAVKINEAIINSFISQGQAIYQERISLINERLKELDTEIRNTQEDIRRTQSLITELLGTTSISQPEISLRIILLQNTLPNYESRLYALKNQRSTLKTLLVKARDFKIFEAALKPEYPIKPKKRQNVTIAGILGLISGIFLAFFMEFLEKNKEVITK